MIFIMVAENQTKPEPLVSIVTPSFNQGQFLEETLHAVLRQDYGRIEHIVIDGGSTDGSVEIIRRNEHRLAWWVSERDHGQSDAIHKGFSRARGDILAWLNSDDLIAPSAVRIAVECFRPNPSVGVVYGDRLHIDNLGNVIGICRCPAYYRAMLRRNRTLPQEATFFRRSVYEKVGGLDLSLHYAMDFDLWCRMAKVTEFYHVSAFLGHYREHPTAKCIMARDNGTVPARQCAAEHLEVYRRHFGKNLPGPWAALWFRLAHKARIAYEHGSRRRHVNGSREGSAYQDDTPVMSR